MLEQGTDEVKKLEKEVKDLREQLTSQQGMYEMTTLYLKKLEEDLKISQKHLAETNKDLLDSINYAKRLQDAFFLHIHGLKKMFPNSFIFQQPKNIVSGDFLWANEKDEIFTIGLGDCTGHGVPGAMLSIFIINMLNQIIKYCRSDNPAFILEDLDKLIYKYLSQTSEQIRDSVEISIIQLDRNKRKLLYSAAKRPLIHIRNKNITIYKGSKYVLGSFDERADPIENIEIDVQKNDTLYMFSDGYTDQFGGEKNIKFSFKRLTSLLLEISDLTMPQQNEILHNTFYTWKGKNSQIDDVLLIGIQI